MGIELFIKWNCRIEWDEYMEDIDELCSDEWLKFATLYPLTRLKEPAENKPDDSHIVDFINEF